MGKMIKGPWAGITYSVDEVRKFTLDHWSEIAKMRKFIVYARRLFLKSAVIWPDQCDHTIELLLQISETIQAFSNFLDRDEKLPYTVYPMCYPLMMVMHRIDAQLKELRLLIVSFSNDSWIPSQQSLLLLEEIRQNLEELSQSWKEAQRDVKLFLDQMESMEEPV